MRVSVPGFRTQFIDEPAVDQPELPKTAPLPSIQAAMAAADARAALAGPRSNPGAEIIPPVQPKPIREGAK